jgi:hypothetical protein
VYPFTYTIPKIKAVWMATYLDRLVAKAVYGPQLRQLRRKYHGRMPYLRAATTLFKRWRFRTLRAKQHKVLDKKHADRLSYCITHGVDLEEYMIPYRRDVCCGRPGPCPSCRGRAIFNILAEWEHRFGRYSIRKRCTVFHYAIELTARPDPPETDYRGVTIYKNTAWPAYEKARTEIRKKLRQFRTRHITNKRLVLKILQPSYDEEEKKAKFTYRVVVIFRGVVDIDLPGWKRYPTNLSTPGRVIGRALEYRIDHFHKDFPLQAMFDFITAERDRLYSFEGTK